MQLRWKTITTRNWIEKIWKSTCHHFCKKTSLYLCIYREFKILLKKTEDGITFNLVPRFIVEGNTFLQYINTDGILGRNHKNHKRNAITYRKHNGMLRIHTYFVRDPEDTREFIWHLSTSASSVLDTFFWSHIDDLPDFHWNLNWGSRPRAHSIHSIKEWLYMSNGLPFERRFISPMPSMSWQQCCPRWNRILSWGFHLEQRHQILPYK